MVIVFVIIVYDVNTKRVNRIKAFLRTHLRWIQNSVFEGETSEGKMRLIEETLNSLINKEKDSVIIYKFRTKKEVKKVVLGKDKELFKNIV